MDSKVIDMYIISLKANYYIYFQTNY